MGHITCKSMGGVLCVVRRYCAPLWRLYFNPTASFLPLDYFVCNFFCQ